MRVAFVTQDIALGALLYGNRRFAKRLIELGHDAAFVAIDSSETEALRSLPAGSQWVALNAKRVRQAPWRLARYFRRNRPDTVFVSGFIQGLACAIAARLVRPTPRILIRSHVASSGYLDRQSGIVDRKLLATLLRFTLSSRILPIAVSNDGARDFENVLGLPLGSVATLYDPVLPVESRNARVFNHPWLDDKSTPLVLSVGRLVADKDFPTLVRAFAEVLRTKPNWRLIILGEGEQREALEKLVLELGLEKSIALPGFLDPENAYRRADLFVCSSASEGLNNAIVEALAAGCRIVSTDCPVGPAEVLERGVYGQLVPVGDVKALAEAMLRAPALPHDRDAGIVRANNFHIDQVWPQFAQLGEIIERR